MKFKRFLSFILVLTVIFGSFTVSASAVSVKTPALAQSSDSVQAQTDEQNPDDNTNVNIVSNTQNKSLVSLLSSVFKAVTELFNKIMQFFTHKENDDYKFSFTVYGYGHGVGMSQLGAIAYSQQGWSYDRILQHYYSGVSLKSENPPACVTYNGRTVDTEDFLIRAVQTELGDNFTEANAQAYKAQAAAIYTLLKYKNYSLSSSNVACSSIPQNKLSAGICGAVRSVWGQFMIYDGKAVCAAFFASSAGKTIDSQSVWGENLPYLTGGAESPEKVAESSSTITAAGMRSLVQHYNEDHKNDPIVLSGEPSQWIEIISSDGVRSDAGYVKKIRLGSVTMSGSNFRTVYNTYKPSDTAYLKSHCFCINKLNYEWPVDYEGSYISSKYGYRTDPISGERKFHGGIDIAAPLGTTITASEAGEVITVKTGSTGYGNYIIIKHNDTYSTLYAHCSEIYVNKGDKVTKGQHIADVGMSGYATGPHLHFEVRNVEETTDPLMYVTKP